MEFNTKIKNLRNAAGLTQKQLAERLGVAKSVVSYYETGDRYPSIDVLIKLAGIFHVTTDYLLDISHAKTLDASELSDAEYIALSNLISAMSAQKK